MEQLSGDDAMPVSDLFAFLEGNWLLSRTINDLRLNTPGVMNGQIAITRQADGQGEPALKYWEDGELQFGDYRETVHRSYDFRFPQAHRARVHFTDGRIFHELDLSSGYCEVEHLCDPDIYRGRFQIVANDLWLSNWNISGPSKDLILDNRYQRLP
ncbi:MAG: hypothetical protein H8E36_02215 [Rhodospirillaceae bacterium]|nr:hypothetical protein [Rhodospirillaceae bacterium]MBL6930273.1 hypothetical protein [Rhodospirillales bacterium]MBL6941811.1 hypothetical protein [Rhodospirillales bacterium]